VRRLRESLLKAGKAPRTVNRILAAYKSYLRICTARGWLVDDPSAAIKQVHVLVEEAESLTDHELIMLRRTVSRYSDERGQLLLDLGIHAGCRIVEVVGLRLADVEMTGRPVPGSWSTVSVSSRRGLMVALGGAGVGAL
jgi:site-specific recombinase XerD